MTKSENFLELYKTLENVAVNYYNVTEEEDRVIYNYLEKDERFEYTKVRYCRKMRNILSHNYNFDNSFIVEPSQDMIKFLEDTIRRIEKSNNIENFWIPKDKMISASLADKVLPKMKEMHKKKITHIPVMENGMVKGVFSENTIFRFFTDNENDGIIEINENLEISAFKKYLSFNNEYGEAFEFINKDAKLVKIMDILKSNYKNNKRVEMFFVTHNGKESEKLLGLITPWDVFREW